MTQEEAVAGEHIGFAEPRERNPLGSSNCGAWAPSTVPEKSAATLQTCVRRRAYVKDRVCTHVLRRFLPKEEFPAKVDTRGVMDEA